MRQQAIPGPDGLAQAGLARHALLGARTLYVAPATVEREGGVPR